MDKQQGYPGPAPHSRSSKKNPLAAAALITALFAVLTICFFPYSIIFSAISILLAIFSRREEPISGIAITSIIVALAAFAASIVITLTAYTLGTSPQYNQFMKEYMVEYESRYQELMPK